MDEWIAVDEKLPLEYEDVILLGRSKDSVVQETFFGYMCYQAPAALRKPYWVQYYLNYVIIPDEVTHWKRKPCIPNETLIISTI